MPKVEIDVRKHPRHLKSGRTISVREHTRMIQQKNPVVKNPKKIDPPYLLTEGSTTLPQSKTQEITFRKKQIEPFKDVTNEEYIFGDFDKDTIANIDDPTPFKESTGSVEEIKLSEELKELKKVRNQSQAILKDVETELEEMNIGDVGGRVKSVNSMINKLRRKRLQEKIPKGIKSYEGLESGRAKGFETYKSITDVIGTMVLVDNLKEVEAAKAKIQAKFKILDLDNFFKDDLEGYRAYHFIIDKKGIPVEIQLKTKRTQKVSQHLHTLYKTGKLSPEKSKQLFTLAYKADSGNKKAIKEFEKLDLPPYYTG